MKQNWGTRHLSIQAIINWLKHIKRDEEEQHWLGLYSFRLEEMGLFLAVTDSLKHQANDTDQILDLILLGHREKELVEDVSHAGCSRQNLLC